MMIERLVKPRVRLSQDDMEVYMFLDPPEEFEEPYTIDELLDCLKSKGVRAGINNSILNAMIQNKIYNREVCVAKGLPVIDGKDGYFVCNFNQESNKKPTLKEDGSVDYWSVNLIETVVKGQVIVQYHQAVEGRDGLNVKGKPVKAKRAKELPPLKGRGFVRTPDNSTYIAAFDGKIEMQRDHIVIAPVHEVFGDADTNYGNIDFPGDILVHGNVCAGISLKATGTITIDGMAEACMIEAGKDVIIRNGVNGGFIKAKGNVVTKYLEYANVSAQGNIQADIFMESQVVCGERITISGKRGVLVGGDVRAVSGIQAKEIGNPVGVRTVVGAGISTEVLQRMQELRDQIVETRVSLARIEKGLSDFDKIERETGVSLRDDPRRSKLLRAKIKDAATIAGAQEELGKLEMTLDKANYATVKVLKTIYPGVELSIDGIIVRVKEYQNSVEFVKKMNNITMNSLLANRVRR